MIIHMKNNLSFLFPVVGLLLVPIVLSSLRTSDDGVGPSSGPDVAAIQGLWSKYPASASVQEPLSLESLQNPVQFYYFHTDGIGLFRYGKVGLNNTHSYDYRVTDDALTFEYRKTGETYRTQFSIKEEGGRTFLHLATDPKDASAPTYVKVSGPMSHSTATEPMDSTGWGRMWTHLTEYKTGGLGFFIYQLHEPEEQGTGIGWFHQGDFDNWSTESLTYQILGDQLQLSFGLRREQGLTGFRVVESEQGRVLRLQTDPRNFWFPQFYLDAGRSFSQTDDGFSSPLLLQLSRFQGR